VIESLRERETKNREQRWDGPRRGLVRRNPQECRAVQP
jgi:hypothetical protein